MYLLSFYPVCLLEIICITGDLSAERTFHLEDLRQLYICALHRGNSEVERGRITTAGEIIGTSLHRPCVLMQVPVVFRNQNGYCLTHHLKHAPSFSWIPTWVSLGNGFSQRTTTICSCWESSYQALSNTRRGDAATFKTRNDFGDPIQSIWYIIGVARAWKIKIHFINFVF